MDSSKLRTRSRRLPFWGVMHRYGGSSRRFVAGIGLVLFTLASCATKDSVDEMNDWPWPAPPSGFSVFAVHVHDATRLYFGTGEAKSLTAVMVQSEGTVVPDAEVTLNGVELTFDPVSGGYRSGVAIGDRGIMLDPGSKAVLEVHSTSGHVRRQATMPGVPEFLSPAPESTIPAGETFIEFKWIAPWSQFCRVQPSLVGSNIELDEYILSPVDLSDLSYVSWIPVQDASSVGLIAYAVTGDAVWPETDSDPIAEGLSGLWLMSAYVNRVHIAE